MWVPQALESSFPPTSTSAGSSCQWQRRPQMTISEGYSVHRGCWFRPHPPLVSLSRILSAVLFRGRVFGVGNVRLLQMCGCRSGAVKEDETETQHVHRPPSPGVRT